MKIIVEGFDNTGKSTLIKKLVKRYHLDVHHAGGPPASSAAAIVDMANQERMSNTIHDRLTAISRQCYEGPENLVPVELQWLQQSLKRVAKTAKFIHCVGRGGEEQYGDYDTPEHRKHLVENELTIRMRYNEIFEDLDHFTYDYNYHTIDDVINFIEGM